MLRDNQSLLFFYFTIVIDHHHHYHSGMLGLEAWPRPRGRETWPWPLGLWPRPRPRPRGVVASLTSLLSFMYFATTVLLYMCAVVV